MIIQFGSRRTPFAIIHTFLLGLTVGGIVVCNGILQERLGASQRSIVDSRGLNITHSINYLYCELPYNDCLCPTLWNATCITYAQLAASRALPVISFTLEMYLIRALFSLKTVYRPIIVCFLWIASILMFIIMIFCLFWTNCFQVYAVMILYFVGALLAILVFRNQEIHYYDETSVETHNINTTVHPSDRSNEVMIFG